MRTRLFAKRSAFVEGPSTCALYHFSDRVVVSGRVGGKMRDDGRRGRVWSLALFFTQMGQAAERLEIAKLVKVRGPLFLLHIFGPCSIWRCLSQPVHEICI